MAAHKLKDNRLQGIEICDHYKIALQFTQCGRKHKLESATLEGANLVQISVRAKHSTGLLSYIHNSVTV